jgi:adenosylhomocysteine nucleosidase
MGWASAARAARNLVDDGATALVSWGTAGALDRALPNGTIVLATEVIWQRPTQSSLVRFESAPLWRARLVHALPGKIGMAQGPLLTSPRALATAEEKSAAFARTHALAVDMESAAVAEVAHASGRPFIAVRAIVDGAGDTLPEPLVRTLQINAESPLQPWQLALRLLPAPAQWAPLAQLARKYRRACNALRSCAPVALACADRCVWDHNE